MYERTKDGQHGNPDEKEDLHIKPIPRARFTRPQQYIITAAIYFAYIAHGIAISTNGSCLIDLAALARTSVGQASRIFIGISSGGIVGALSVSPVARRFGLWIPLGIAYFVNGTTFLVLPWCARIEVMIALMVVFGIGCYFVNGALCAAVVEIWGGENGPWMLGLNCVYGIGAMLAPLIAKPFILVHQAFPTTDQLNFNRTATNERSIKTFGLENISDISLSTTPVNVMSKNDTGVIEHGVFYSNESGGDIDPPKTIVYIAYIIVSGLLFLGSTLCLGAGLYIWKFQSPCSKTVKGTICTDDNERQSPKVHTYLLISFLFLFLCSVMPIEHSVFMFLFTFAVKSAGMGKDSAVFLVFLYMLAYNISRGLSALIIHWSKPKTILIVNILLTIIFTTTIFFGYTSHIVVLWVASTGLGFAMAPLFGAGIVFFNIYHTVTPFVGGMTALASTVSGLIAPAILSALYKHIGAVSFIYINLVSSLLMLVFFICLAVMGKKMKKLTFVTEKQIDA